MAGYVSHAKAQRRQVNAVLCASAPLREIFIVISVRLVISSTGKIRTLLAAVFADLYSTHFREILLSRSVSIRSQLAAQRTQANTKCFGCFGAVTVATLQGCHDQPTFHFVERYIGWPRVRIINVGSCGFAW